MFFNTPISGKNLSEKTICLTFDDGPGPQTNSIGKYLFQNGIHATFFVCGKHVEKYSNVIRNLIEWGHLVANHTYDHARIVKQANSGESPACQLKKTDLLISEFINRKYNYFRAPWGQWRDTNSFHSNTARLLNKEPELKHYIGPIHWDIGAYDWKYWEGELDFDKCAKHHLDAIRRNKRGIILLHDSSATSELAIRGNRQLELLEAIIPILLEEGYKFIRLDAIPQVHSATMVTQTVTIHCEHYNSFVICESNYSLILSNICDSDAGQEFGIVDLEGGAIALRASNGNFVSINAVDSKSLVANATCIETATKFKIQPEEGSYIKYSHLYSEIDNKFVSISKEKNLELLFNDSNSAAKLIFHPA